MEFPPYSYVPGGPWPHPTRDPEGHLADRSDLEALPIEDEPNGTGSAEFDQARALFNQGYYWEAHECWESLWHAHRRTGPTADLLKALIKLAAAGVKVREGQPHGVRTHAGRAGELLASVKAEVGPTWLGLDLTRLESLAERVQSQAEQTETFLLDLPVAKVFDFEI